MEAKYPRIVTPLDFTALEVATTFPNFYQPDRHRIVPPED
jgi:hypothetical protein